MMQFMHSHRSGRSLAPRGAAILIAALAGGGAPRSPAPIIQASASPARNRTRRRLCSRRVQTAARRPPPTAMAAAMTVAATPRRAPTAMAASPWRTCPTPPSNRSQPSTTPTSAAAAPVSSPRAPAACADASWRERRRRAGDTLYGLSRQHHVSVAELMEVNQLNNPNLHPGQRLYLPQGYSAQPRSMSTARRRAAARQNSAGGHGQVPVELYDAPGRIRSTASPAPTA